LHGYSPVDAFTARGVQAFATAPLRSDEAGRRELDSRIPR